MEDVLNSSDGSGILLFVHSQQLNFPPGQSIRPEPPVSFTTRQHQRTPQLSVLPVSLRESSLSSVPLPFRVSDGGEEEAWQRAGNYCFVLKAAGRLWFWSAMTGTRLPPSQSEAIFTSSEALNLGVKCVRKVFWADHM